MEQAAQAAPSTDAQPAQATPENAAPEVIAETPETPEAEVPRETSELAEGKKEPVKFKRKVNGKLIEATEDELWKHYGLEVTAREKLQTAAKQAKEAQDKVARIDGLFEEMKTRPDLAFEILDRLGHDSRKLMRAKILEEMEYERLPADAKRAVDAERKLKEYQDKEKQREEFETQQKNAVLQRVSVERVDNVLSESLKLSGLSPKPRTVAKMAEACQTLLRTMPKGQFPEPQKIVEKFLSLSRQDASEIMVEQDVAKLIELGILNDNSIKKVAEWYLEKSKKNLPSFGASGRASTSEANKKPSSEKEGIQTYFKRKFGV
jgi:hypothetical protein